VARNENFICGAGLASIRLRDLQEWHCLHGVCKVCNRGGPIDYRPLVRRFGAETTLDAIERRLRCRRCGGRPLMQELQVYRMGR
jgi:hypothetical protein